MNQAREKGEFLIILNVVQIQAQIYFFPSILANVSDIY